MFLIGIKVAKDALDNMDRHLQMVSCRLYIMTYSKRLEHVSVRLKGG